MNIKDLKNQMLWVRYLDSKGKFKWLVTSDLARSKYILYSVGEKENLTKIKTAKQPLFDEIIKG